MGRRLARGAAWLALSWATWATPTASAMTLERVGSDLFATGPVVDADLLAYKEALAVPGLRRLVLVNSPGGDAWTALQVARLVRSAEIDTLVSGGCASACSLIFIAGKERAFATGFRPTATAIGIHGTHDPETKMISNGTAPQLYTLYKSQIGEKFDAEVMNQALYKIEDAYGMLRMRELQRNRPVDQAPWFCPRGSTPPAQCQRYVGKDAFSLGIVTKPETVEIELPSAFRPVLGFYGQALAEPTPDTTRSKLLARLQAACEKLTCKAPAEEQLDGWMGKGSYRALAVASNAPGFGMSAGVGNAGAAMVRALYACNHQGRGHKLCQVLALDDHDLEPHYTQALGQGRTLLAQLGAPAEAALRAEREEPAVSTARSYRTALQVYLTPGAVAGARKVDTAEMAALLRGPQPPVLIDVAAQGATMLPTALHFIGGGTAFEDEKQDASFDRRFRDMLDAAAPDKSAPVVFYCSGSSSWQSVNAALRAMKAGYTQVLWYRGGVNAWQAAGLPTVGKVPVAALQ